MSRYIKHPPKPGPPCPLGHPGHTVRCGTHSRYDDAFTRQRFRCFNSDGTVHSFSLSQRIPRGAKPSAYVVQRQQTLRHYVYTINEMVEAIIDVGCGLSAREAGRRLRVKAKRPPQSVDRYPENGTVSRYLDLYGPTILAQVLPEYDLDKGKSAHTKVDGSTEEHIEIVEWLVSIDAWLEKLDATFSARRPYSNERRKNIVWGIMVAQMMGRADTRWYARIIRTQVKKNGNPEWSFHPKERYVRNRVTVKPAAV